MHQHDEREPVAGNGATRPTIGRVLPDKDIKGYGQGKRKRGRAGVLVKAWASSASVRPGCR